jgi:protein-tyrosine-phosphatase
VNVLFVCVANSGRSVMAERIFVREAGGRHEARSAGSAPGVVVHPQVLEALDEIGIDASDHVPRGLDDEAIRWADVVVATCDDACPVLPGKRYLAWQLPDPKREPLERVREIRDEIEGRVRELLAELDAPHEPTTHAERWLEATWPVVRGWLPTAPARVLEIGCGPLGGFVPRLRSAGYDAVGVDPEAPAGDDFRRVEFERLVPERNVDAVIASASLHHVGDPGEVINAIASIVEPRGRVMVIEWDWAAFDRRTAEWCFRRLGPDEEHGWLRHHRDRWAASKQPWDEYLAAWAQEERIHPAAELLRLLDERFVREHLADGPYFFPDLPGTTEEDESAAIAAGDIRANRLDYVGRRRP